MEIEISARIIRSFINQHLVEFESLSTYIKKKHVDFNYKKCGIFSKPEKSDQNWLIGFLCQLFFNHKVSIRTDSLLLGCIILRLAQYCVMISCNIDVVIIS